MLFGRLFNFIFIFKCSLFLNISICHGLVRRVHYSQEDNSYYNDLGSKISLDKLGNFVDAQGRICMFHGINSVNKGFPWYTASLLNETKLSLYQKWGFNIVRLGTMWSGYMPQRGVFNESYINIQKRIVGLLAKYGMYSLMDMHQDVISSRYYSYDGVPRWLIDSFPQETGRLKYPWPLKKPAVGDDWFKGYLTYAVGNAFQQLYDNTTSSLNYWAQFWKRVAKDFGGWNSVIGYELINEPWAGNVYSNPFRILPGYAGRNNLLPVYDFLTKEIRSIDNRTLIFYEPVTWGVYFSGGGDSGTGFNRVPGGPSEVQRSVLSYHYYCWLLQVPSPARPYPHWEEIVCDDIALKRMFSSTAGSAKRTGGGRMLTEYGLCAPDNSSKSVNTVECDTVMKQADDNLQSWSYWDSEFFDRNGNIIWSRVQSFARTYPRATAGIPKSLYFNITTGAFKFSYLLNATLAKSGISTEIFVPTSVHYSKGFSVKIMPKNLMETAFDKKNHLLNVRVMKGHIPKNDTIINVTIIRK